MNEWQPCFGVVGRMFLKLWSHSRSLTAGVSQDLKPTGERFENGVVGQQHLGRSKMPHEDRVLRTFMRT